MPGGLSCSFSLQLRSSFFLNKLEAFLYSIIDHLLISISIMFTSILLAACLATELYALPLNINLGAYSPALVVGDGEISFGGDQDVSNLMNALEGAAVTNAQNNGAAAPGVEAQPQQEQAQVAPVPTTSAVPRETQNQEVQNLPQGKLYHV